MTRVLAVINFIDQFGRPVDPGFGVGSGEHPSTGPIYGGGHPSTGPIYGGGHPDNDLPPWDVSVWPPGPVDPVWGVDSPARPSHPIYMPIGPDHSLPPVAGHLPAPNPPPGTIWPPLPEGAPEGKAALLIWLVGVGWRYMVVTIPPTPEPKK